MKLCHLKENDETRDHLVSEIPKTQEDKYHRFSLIYGILGNKRTWKVKGGTIRNVNAEKGGRRKDDKKG
jgi:hypothetical protein